MGCCSSKRTKTKITGWVDGLDKETTHTPHSTELTSIPKKSIITSTQNVLSETNPSDIVPAEPAEPVDIFKTKLPGTLQDNTREGHIGYAEARVVVDNLFSSEEDMENAAVIQAVVRAHLARKHKQREQENFSILRAPLLSKSYGEAAPTLLIPQVPSGAVKTKSQLRGTKGGPGMVTTTSVQGLRGQLTFNSPAKSQPALQAPD